MRGLSSMKSTHHFLVRLKCDRKEPCGNCATRGVDCVYATVSRSRNSAHTRHGNQHLDARIRQLEHLVGTSVAPGSQIEGAVYPSNIQELGFAIESREQVTSDQAQSNDIEVKPGHMISNSGEVVYVSGIHWAAICNEVKNRVKVLGGFTIGAHLGNNI